MNFTPLRYGLCFVFIFCHILLQGQPLLRHIEKLTTDNGLSSNAVTDILQDQRGFLWIATLHGLNRYDGTEVVQYFSDNRPGSLPGNTIYRLIYSDPFHIIMATPRGLGVFDTRNDSARNLHFYASTKVGLSEKIRKPPDDHVFLLEKDIYDNLWAGTPSSIYRLDKKLEVQKIFHSGFETGDIEGTRLRFVYKILPLSTGEVLFWLASGVHVWKPETDTLMEIGSTPDKKWNFLKGSLPYQCFSIYNRYLVFINYRTNSLSVTDELTGESVSCSMPRNNKKQISGIRCISGMSDGWMAVSFDGNGIAWVRLQNNNGKLSISSDNHIYLADNTLGKWLRDSEESLWIATATSGLLKASPGKQLFEEKELKEQHEGNFSAYEIMSFYKIKKQLFVATYGNGFYEWELTSGNVNHHPALHGAYSENMVWNFRRHTSDTLWLGTQQGLLWYNMRSKKLGRLFQKQSAMLDSFPITMQFTDSKGLIWLGAGYGKGTSVYDPQKKTFTIFPYKEDAYPYRYPMSVAEDKDSNLWFISDATPHLVKWIRKENRFRKIIIPQFHETAYVQTGGFYLDRQKGNIWYGVQTAGLVRYNIDDGTVKVYGMEDGLSTDMIFSILIDKRGILWLSTSQGISSFDPEQEHFVNYKQGDGLPASYFSAKMYYDTTADMIYAGAPGKVVYFSPSAFNEKKEPLKVILTGLLINNKPAPLPDNRRITLPWRSNDITLSFTGINLTNGNENKYAYRLGNDHTEWINIGSQRQIRLANLNPGHYAFEVKASRKDGSWGTLTDHLELNIRKPFARTIWFYLICFAFTCGVIYGWYRYRFIQLLRLEGVRSRISHDLHDEIGSRLTNIGMMSQIVGQKQPEYHENNDWLQQIQEESEAISQSMREIIWNINPDNDSMEEAMPRMLHFATGLLETKGIIVKAFIPDLAGIKIDMEKRRDMFAIFKETIHNVARHSGAKYAVIRANREKKVFKLEITDDGKGFAKDELAFHNGLKYMHHRAKKNNWKLNVISRSGEGTGVTLEIKIT